MSARGWAVYHVGEPAADGARWQHEDDDGERCGQPAISHAKLPGNAAPLNLRSAHDGRCQIMEGRGRCPERAARWLVPGRVPVLGAAAGPAHVCAKHHRQILDPIHAGEGGPGSAAWEGILTRIGRKRGGKAEKFDQDVQHVVDVLAAKHRQVSATSLYELLPDSRCVDEDELERTVVYRDGTQEAESDDRCVCVFHGKTGRRRKIAYATFRTYVARARKKYPKVAAR